MSRLLLAMAGASAIGSAMAAQHRRELRDRICLVAKGCRSTTQCDGAVRYLERALVMAPDRETERLARKSLARALNKRRHQRLLETAHELHS